MNIYEAYKRTTTNQIKQMAIETGIALNTFYAIFNGTSGGSKQTRDALTQYLGVTDFVMPEVSRVQRMKDRAEANARQSKIRTPKVKAPKKAPKNEAWMAHLAKVNEFKPLQPRPMPLGYQPYHAFGKEMR